MEPDESDEIPVPVFGQCRPGEVYVERPGAYALIADEAGRLAVVRNEHGRHFLPGGGIEPGESLELALRREVVEECGRQVDELQLLCAADEYVEDREDARCYLKRGTFFVATLHVAPVAASEPGTELLWLSPAEAARRLAHPSQSWVVRQYAQVLGWGGLTAS
jgi:8-oxo-dGTP diphosphatase